MNPIAIVAFTGPAGSGKDTAGKLLIDHHGFKRLSFAMPLKAMLAAAGYPEPATQDEKEKLIPELGVSWRHMAQTLGTEWGRHEIHPDLWVILAEKMVRAEGGRWVITDCRFENEAAMVRRMNGIVVHLKGRRHAMSEGTKGHVSEKGIEFHPHDVTILNEPIMKPTEKVGGVPMAIEDEQLGLSELHSKLKLAIQYVGVQ